MEYFSVKVNHFKKFFLTNLTFFKTEMSLRTEWMIDKISLDNGHIRITTVIVSEFC